MNQTYKEIIEDEIYLKAFNAAKKQFDKRYNKLFDAAKQFFHFYDSTFGEPDGEKGNERYFDLAKIVNVKNLK